MSHTSNEKSLEFLNQIDTGPHAELVVDELVKHLEAVPVELTADGGDDLVLRQVLARVGLAEKAALSRQVAQELHDFCDRMGRDPRSLSHKEVKKAVESVALETLATSPCTSSSVATRAAVEVETAAAVDWWDSVRWAMA